eukprot:TRINITY_DN1455_c0_g1_i1.p2 TRINITY_DN1455_c0_g1~~TRINITY_DN1455_c0_g1_i1.p2  ORF type:complete len:161 (-),score=23.06 TRINITY_DN1455_c0_g1_i1:82-564(-)
MDPTPPGPSIFAMRGSRAMNSQAQQSWKELINKEASVNKQWKAKHARDLVEEETNLLLESFRRDRDLKEAQDPSRRSPVRAALYDGVSKDGGGRKAYLREMHKVPPKEKGEFPRTSAQEIGWRCDQNSFEQSEYGRKPVIESSFFRGRGVFSDPPRTQRL